MRKISPVLTVLGLLALTQMPVLADESKGPPKKPAATAPAQKPGDEHRHGMDHGGQQMHDKMMKDHREGMEKMQDQSGGGCGGNDKPMPAMGGMGTSKPADKPKDMPMKHEHM
ncbi:MULTISPECIES: hypothetical protein [Sphingopyxis]|jgi:hypothetical protein|nr:MULTISPECIES: hypothetical protein [Sphingopyxis]MCM3420783.1 hypothetical protein [Sphingopyxis alaskensis]HEV7312311.1 hypothetical protein [Sphingopyxis sp.]